MKSTKQKLRAEADRLWYNIIIQDHPICEGCGKEKSIQAHHYYYKGSFGHLRFCLLNGIGLGIKCHFLLHFGGNPDIQQKITEKRGKIWYNNLRRKAFNKPKSSYQTIKWYEENIGRLKKQTLVASEN